MNNFKTLAVSTLSVVLLATVVSTQAQEYSGARYDEKTEAVSTSFLNLANPVDAQILIDRIQSAAKRACLRNASSNRLAALNNYESCVSLTYQSTIASIDNNHGTNIEAIATITEQQPGIAAVSE